MQVKKKVKYYNSEISIFIENTIAKLFTETFQGGKTARNSCYHVTISIQDLQRKQNFSYTNCYIIRYKCSHKKEDKKSDFNFFHHHTTATLLLLQRGFVQVRCFCALLF